MQKNMSLKKEIETLQAMGVPDYQIAYLVHEKYKEDARQKWR